MDLESASTFRAAKPPWSRRRLSGHPSHQVIWDTTQALRSPSASQSRFASYSSLCFISLHFFMPPHEYPLILYPRYCRIFLHRPPPSIIHPAHILPHALIVCFLPITAFAHSSFASSHNIMTLHLLCTYCMRSHAPIPHPFPSRNPLHETNHQPRHFSLPPAVPASRIMSLCVSYSPSPFLVGPGSVSWNFRSGRHRCARSSTY